MEDELGDKPYFGGEDFGYVDVALVPFTSWFYTVETCGKLSIEKECPKLMAWAKRCMEKESVATPLPHPHQIYAFAMQYKQSHGLEYIDVAADQMHELMGKHILSLGIIMHEIKVICNINL